MDCSIGAVTGSWAVIAGGSDGTGACFAREAAASGINLLLIARRPGPLEALAVELRREHGVEIRTVSHDLSAPDATARMAQATEGLEVGLYISNAGAESGGHHFLDTPLETIHQLIARNVLTVADACHHFGGLMRARGRGGHRADGIGRRARRPARRCRLCRRQGFRPHLGRIALSELRGAGVDVIGIAAPIMETPTLRRTLGDMQIPGIFQADDVAQNALRRLPEDAATSMPSASSPEDAEHQTKLRRDRVLEVERISAALFSGH
ncbi:MAG: SDR family NAD(P)-dependent oxidoreductase [Aliidongia sp.]